MSLNVRMKELRESRKLSQKKLATELGISDRNYQRYEYGERVPDADLLTKLANYFDVSLDYLTGRCDNPDSHKTVCRDFPS